MPMVSVLGPVLLDGHPLPDDRPTQLLVLLAMAPAGRPRVQVAERLWPSLPPPAALRNLRKTLHRLRAQGLGGLLADNGGRLQLTAECDWSVAERAAVHGSPGEVLGLMRGVLADGLRDDVGWLASAREAALALWRQALLAALPALDEERAEAELQRLRAIDPHDEGLLRAHLQRLAAAGRADAFARVRAGYVQRLADDLGVGPSATLLALAPPVQAPLPTPPAVARAGATPIVGRDDEIETLQAWLGEPGAWVALRGPGGIGKTRLAAALAERRAAAGGDVVW